VKRRFRLTRSIDFKRVRRSGKSYAHPLIVLYALRSDHPVTRVGVTAGVTVGNAVRRNRTKRLLRTAMRTLIPDTVTGYDLILMARSPLAGSNLEETRLTLIHMLQRARLLSKAYDG
jgi:ribonuclease P protein component